MEEEEKKESPSQIIMRMHCETIQANGDEMFYFSLITTYFFFFVHLLGTFLIFVNVDTHTHTHTLFWLSTMRENEKATKTRKPLRQNMET